MAFPLARITRLWYPSGNRFGGSVAMTRMSREFSLVLLGSGILTAGYFLAPDPADAMADKADKQVGDRVAANDQNRRHYYGGSHVFIWAHSPGYTARYGGSTS